MSRWLAGACCMCKETRFGAFWQQQYMQSGWFPCMCCPLIFKATYYMCVYRILKFMAKSFKKQ
jgi:hypothetical protein